MVEPTPLAIEKERTETFSLWADAPAWRTLTVAATLFTVAAASLYFPILTHHPSPAVTPAPPQLSDQRADLPNVSPQPSTTAASLPQIPPSNAPSTAHVPAPVVAHNQALSPAAAPQIAPAPAHAPKSAGSVSRDATASHEEALATAEPQAAPQPQQTVCLLVAPPAPTHFNRGTVMAFEDKATSLARIKHNEAEVGGQIDPDFIDNQRVNVRLGDGSYHIFIVPKSLAVRLGDAVATQSLYKNVNRTCQYIPPLVTSDFGPAPDKDSSATKTADH